MKKNDIFWGILLILAAALIIVSKMGLLLGVGIIEIIITVVLVGIMIKSLFKISFPGILFPAAFLCIIYAEEWNITAITPGPVLITALLGSIGLSLIFGNTYFCHHNLHHHWDKNWNGKEHFDKIVNEPDGNVINCATTFGSTVKYINTEQFERMNIKCTFGAMKIYFDKAVIQNDSAEIFIDASFCGVELFVPRTWKIVDKTNTSFGAMEEKNKGMDTQTPVVTIHGNLSFGGIEIIYV